MKTLDAAPVQPGPDEPRHPIQVVARRTGLTADAIRVWERRYAAVTPSRTATTRRLFSDADVHRLSLLARATRGGRRISDVAGLSTKALEEIVAEDTPPALPAPASSEGGGVHVQAALAATRSLDAEALARSLARASLALPIVRFLDEVALPLLRAVGDEWNAGTMRPTHEHLASAAVRSCLATLTPSAGTPSDAPVIVLTTPAGQLHDIGTLAAATCAALQGWRVVYLGANLPNEEVAAAAEQTGARVIALGLVPQGDDERTADGLRRLRAMLPSGAELVLGGDAVRGVDALASLEGVSRTRTLAEFRGLLDAIQRGATPRR